MDEGRHKTFHITVKTVKKKIINKVCIYVAWFILLYAKKTCMNNKSSEGGMINEFYTKSFLFYFFNSRHKDRYNIHRL